MPILKKYYNLTKPGIVYGNLLAATAGFAIGSYYGINWSLLLLTLAGLGCVIASACVFNNYLDRDIDAKMTRTKERALVKNKISAESALLFAFMLGFLGSILLLFFTTVPAFAAAMLGFVVYVSLYTPLKRKNSVALYVGAVAGATPPVVGYLSASGILDVTAVILFVLMFVWQLPHFIAIAVFRYDEYTAAGIPLVVKRSYTDKTKRFAKKLFLASIITLPVACVGAVLWRLLFT